VSSSSSSGLMGLDTSISLPLSFSFFIDEYNQSN
jgi:hypothetical protein